MIKVYLLTLIVLIVLAYTFYWVFVKDEDNL